MIEHTDFVEQETHTTEDGRLRPDLMVRLPGGKRVIVDAKAPLAAYFDAVEADDDAERAAKYLADHARQVRDHLVKLGSKAYWSQFADTPEFVVMFLPGEAFFSAALSQDPLLIEQGIANRVVLASPDDADCAAEGRRVRLAPGADRGERAARSASSGVSSTIACSCSPRTSTTSAAGSTRRWRPTTGRSASLETRVLVDRTPVPRAGRRARRRHSRKCRSSTRPRASCKRRRFAGCSTKSR